MKKIGKILFGILEAAIIVYVLFVTTCLLCKNKYGYTQIENNTYAIVNEENEDYFKDFDLDDILVFSKVRYKDVEVGDKLYYYDTEYQSYVIKEGVVFLKQGNSKRATYTLETKENISSDRIIGKYKTKYAGLGKVFNVLTSRFGFLILVILPIFMIFVYQVYKTIVLIRFGDDEKEA